MFLDVPLHIPVSKLGVPALHHTHHIDNYFIPECRTYDMVTLFAILLY